MIYKLQRIKHVSTNYKKLIINLFFYFFIQLNFMRVLKKKIMLMYN